MSPLGIHAARQKKNMPIEVEGAAMHPHIFINQSRNAVLSVPIGMANFFALREDGEAFGHLDGAGVHPLEARA
jgi:hypothetical protein